MVGYPYQNDVTHERSRQFPNESIVSSLPIEFLYIRT